ncbi:MAG: glycogen synthase [Thermoleophilaceae bacterium]|nr:glycogen synthase [Thermoleophilaceae bacterium]
MEDAQGPEDRKKGRPGSYDGSVSRERRSVALIVTPKYLPFLGGMERECALLAGELRRLGFEPVVITEQLGLDTARHEHVEGVTIHRVPSSPERSLATQLRVAARMALLVARYRRGTAFAVIRTLTLPALLVGLLKKLRIVSFPTLVTAETGGSADDVVALAERPLFPLSRALVSTHDRLNGICQANVDHLHEHGFPAEKITFIPNGIDTAPFTQTAAPERVRRFLFLGRIEREKGVFELLDAFKAVVADHPGVTLTIAGEGPAAAELERRSADLGLEPAVRFAGRIPYERLGALFDAHDCLVLPSYSEGMPLSVLEAAAHRLVLVITDVGDVRALFGPRIRICPPRDTGALTEAMRAAVDDPHPAAEYGDVIERVAIAAVAREMLDRLAVPAPQEA